MKQILALFSFLFIFTASNSYAKNCEEVRMGIDIGSGSTKVMVAKVDFCHNKILEVLYNESMPVAYTEDLDKSKDGNLSPAIIDSGLKTLNGMVTKARELKPKKSYGVATAVFRKAKNGADVIKNFARKLNLRMEVITQENEAHLSYLSVLSLMGQEALSKSIIVWDIGGSSMQMFSLDKDKKPQRYLGFLASISFKNMVIEVIQGKNLESVTSPNPIGDKREQALAMARSYAKAHVPDEIKADIKDRVVVGVGGVHGQSIKNQLDLKTSVYTVAELDKVAKIQSQKSDKELTGDYRATDVTNLLLVQGFMEGLGIKEVNIYNASLIQGAMFK